MSSGLSENMKERTHLLDDIVLELDKSMGQWRVEGEGRNKLYVYMQFVKKTCTSMCSLKIKVRHMAAAQLVQTNMLKSQIAQEESEGKYLTLT